MVEGISFRDEFLNIEVIETLAKDIVMLESGGDELDGFGGVGLQSCGLEVESIEKRSLLERVLEFQVGCV